MGLQTYRHGALFVVEQGRDKDFTNRDLRKLDRRLFCERQITLTQEAVWCVVLDAGLETGPVTVLEFRDSAGRPMPHLSSGIVEETRKMLAAGPLDVRAIAERNRTKVEKLVTDATDQMRDIAADFEKRKRRTMAIPRSRALQRSRARNRRTKGDIEL